MDNFLQLDIYESPIDEFFGMKEFNEFGSIMRMLDYYGTPHSVLYEAVLDPSNKIKQGAKMAVSNTISTTGDVINAYDKTTTANANIIKATWDLFVKCVNLTVKGISKILNALANVPLALSNTIDRIGRIPQSLRVKIRGDIALYITIEDVEMLYNQSLLKFMSDIIEKADLLSRGDTWTGLFGRKKTVIDSNGEVSKINERKLLKEIAGLTAKIESIKFEPTVVRLTNERLVDIYFNKDFKAINFQTLDGTQKSGSYYEALNALLGDLKLNMEKMKDVKAAMSIKLQDSKENNNFTRLDASTRNMITDGIQNIAKTISIVGNIIRYVAIDLSTITKAANGIRKRAGTKND